MGSAIRRRTEEKELQMAAGFVGTRGQLEQRGWTYRGALHSASEQGYFTPRACESMGRPVSAEELCAAENFAVMADCHTDLRLIDEVGQWARPCIPVFFRG